MGSELEKKIKTAVLVYIWATKGLYADIGGPTMIDLMLVMNVNHERVARAVSALGLGSFPGAFIAGIFTDKLGNWKDLIMAISQTIAAIGVVLMPFVPNPDILWALFFIVGTATSVINIVGQKFIFEIWEEKAPSPMHALHMGFGIGALTAPLIANNFLAVTSSVTSSSNTTNSTTLSSATPSPDDIIVVQKSRVQYAFIIIALITLVGGLPFWFYQIRRCLKDRTGQSIPDGPKQTTSRTFKELVNPATYADGSLRTGIFLIIIIFMIYVNQVGAEQMFGNFVRTYSVDALKFTRDNASYVDLVYWLGFTIGRFSGSVLARCIPIRILYLAELFLFLASSTITQFLAANSQLSLWILTGVQGFIVAPLYASCISFGNTQIEITGLILMIVDFGTGIGLWFYVWIAGYLYDNLGPRAVLILLQIAGIVVFVFGVTFLIVGHFRGNRFVKLGEKLSEKANVHMQVDGVLSTELDVQKKPVMEQNGI